MNPAEDYANSSLVKVASVRSFALEERKNPAPGSEIKTRGRSDLKEFIANQKKRKRTLDRDEKGETDQWCQLYAKARIEDDSSTPLRITTHPAVK